jgi:hypothetical protein
VADSGGLSAKARCELDAQTGDEVVRAAEDDLDALVAYMVSLKKK